MCSRASTVPFAERQRPSRTAVHCLLQGPLLHQLFLQTPPRNHSRRKQASSGSGALLDSAEGLPLCILSHQGSIVYQAPYFPSQRPSLICASSQVAGRTDLSAGPTNPFASPSGRDCAIQSPAPHWPAPIASARSNPRFISNPIWGPL